MTTSYFYSYIETTSYQTTYTITLKARQSRYSLTGEWWESNDGKNWGKVTSNDGRESTLCPSGWGSCYTYFCPGTCCSGYSASSVQMNPKVWAVASSLKAGTTSIVALDRGGVNGFCTGWKLTQKAVPVILYFRSNESVTASGIDGYSISGVSMTLYESCWGEPFCLLYVTEWGRTYKLQAIELVDWDTGEVYASLNQTSLTFNINANTIVRFKYVLTSSWSRSWEVILQPPPPTPDQCQQILNDPNARCKGDWCSCLRQFDPEAWKNTPCCYTIRSCLSVSVDFCCSGAEKYSCLASQSGQGGRNCVEFTAAEVQQGVTKPLSPVSWSASWSLKQGWVYDRIVQVGDYNPPYCTGSASGNSASGKCCIDRECISGNVGPNKYYRTTVVIVFKNT
jgi:hypothetical protein